jgi:hypothetical protein
MMWIDMVDGDWRDPREQVERYEVVEYLLKDGREVFGFLGWWGDDLVDMQSTREGEFLRVLEDDGLEVVAWRALPKVNVV